MTRIIHISGNSGSGKSVLALNLGIALSQKGREVILVDGNIYSADIANYSDISPEVFLNEFLDGEKDIEETIVFHPSGMKMILSMAEKAYTPEKHEKLNKALLSLTGKTEFVLVDSFSHSPALFSVIDNADEMIFVTNDDFPSILKSKEFIKKIESKGTNIVGVVLNKKRKNSNKKHIEAILEKRVLVEIPYDKNLIDTVNMKQPISLVYPKSETSKAITELAKIIDIWER
ncbi:MAG: P-loop NTPase [Nanoarchaeota archaeon]|nr:P-loop NTPase [Nanoarchaeota archaeon]